MTQSVQRPTGSDLAPNWPATWSAFLDSLLTSHSGTARPAYVQAGTMWYNTSTGYVYIYDGAQDLPLFKLDVANHLFVPPIGGGINTIASAATVDLGSVAESSVSITGTVAISSFGSTAKNGQIKVVTFAAGIVLTNSANMVLSGGINRVTAAGDVGMYRYESAGTLWREISYVTQSSQKRTITPQGRLTLASNTPVMNADATAQSTIYYTPYIGDQIPIFDGVQMVPTSFSQLSQALDSNSGNTNYHQSGKIFDCFVFMNGSVVTLGTGPAWASSTARGTGAGTTELQQTNGLWTNKNTIALKYDATNTTISVPAGKATYVGSFYATANGQTAMQMFNGSAVGGGNPYAVLYNAYNRINIASRCSDTTASWTYTTNVVRPLNNSTLNRINILDGLGQSRIETVITQSALGNNIYLGAALDNTTTPFLSCYNASTVGAAISGANNVAPQLGFHYIQATENGGGGASGTYYGANTLLVKMDM